MDVPGELRRARLSAGLTQRALAVRAATSQAAVAAYETGRKRPSIATFERLLAACGADLAVRPRASQDERLHRSGERLAQVLELAEHLPFRREDRLRFPRLPSRSAA